MKKGQEIRIQIFLCAIVIMVAMLSPMEVKAAVSLNYYSCLDAPDNDTSCVANSYDTCTKTIHVKHGEIISMDGWVLSNDKVRAYEVTITYDADTSVKKTGVTVEAKEWEFPKEFDELIKQNNFQRTNSLWRFDLDTTGMQAGNWTVFVKAKRSSNAKYFNIAKIKLVVDPGYAVCEDGYFRETSINTPIIKKNLQYFPVGYAKKISVNGWALHDKGISTDKSSAYVYQIKNASNKVVKSGNLKAYDRTDLKDISNYVKIGTADYKTNVGYSGELSITGLGVGKYTAVITGKTKDNKTFEVSRIEFAISEVVSPKKISFSGNASDHVKTDRLSYYEGEKFVLLLDKDLDMPGDFAKNIGLIIDELERLTGLSYSIDQLNKYSGDALYYGYNPWKNISFGTKVPIYVRVDYDDAGLIPCACDRYMLYYSYRLFSKEVLNSVPSYRNNPFRYQSMERYYEIAHELTHVLTLRHATLTEIMTEGSADYYAIKVIKSLANKYSVFSESLNSMFFSGSVSKNVTPDNAEAVFRNDYKDLTHGDRGDQYTLGRMMCSFLAKNYGETFLKKYVEAAEKAGYNYFGLNTRKIKDDDDRNKHVEILKQIFGDDVFRRFGTYYQEHKK
ncbi:MAG: hypothetical protein IK081_15905 [Lachnospiraceae bacterium]|nr:hypothetical protein [Lachnospiraceae bacterium]